VSPSPSPVIAARPYSPVDSSSSASIAALLAEARGDAPSSEPTAATGARARATHHGWHKQHYTAEPIASPDPAPPIVVGPAAAPSAHSVVPPTTAQTPVPAPPDAPTPYDEPVPDLGSRD
jgi:hypothetical protein